MRNVNNIKKSNIQTLVGVFICVIFVFLLLILRSYTYANEENIYYVDDLKVGDYLPNGSVVVTNSEYYYTASGFTTNYIAFVYTNPENGRVMESKNIPINSKYTIKKYNDFDENNFNHEGWIITKITIDANESMIYLKPTDDYSFIEEEPSFSNNYFTSASCLAPEANYAWFSKKTIDTYTVKENNGNSYWKANDGIANYYRSSDDEKLLTETQDSLIYTFEANQGDLLSFLMKSRLRTGEVDIYLDGKNLKYNDTALYTQYTYPIESDGQHTLEIKASSYYFPPSLQNKTESWGIQASLYIKDLQIFKLINEGQTLNQTLVKDGDNIQYLAVCSDGYILGKSLVYKAPKTEEPEKIENPNTKDIVIGMIVLFACLCGLIIVKNTKKIYYLTK